MTLVFKGGTSTGSTLDVTFDVEASKAHNGAKMPIKLGDGNFGAVFAAVGGGKQLAIKVIYAHQMPDLPDGSPPQIENAILYKRQRVEDELRVREDIFRKLSEKQAEHPEYAFLINNFDRHLVLPINYTDALAEAEEFIPFAEQFRQTNIEFSGHAYAMERFECSLKDLMDYGGRGPDSARASGYSKLKLVGMAERERSAIPVLLQVAAGLRVLHAAKYRHQDIKPANVYYRRNAVGNVEFRLGDLGFLNARPAAQGGTVLASSEALAIGTKHYRSVEQIDYADTSEVTVRTTEDPRTAMIQSRDPKFARTNIAKGDLVVFPQSASKYQYQITQFDVVDDETAPSGKRVDIEINVPVDAQNSHTLLADDSTQASFIKNPTSRTDLFGLGGLLFDILTAGDSPERFYELLRKFDVKGESIQDSVLSYYDNWKAEQYADADVAAIFQRVAGPPSTSKLSIEVLTFLLRCCASNCTDSFFHEFNFDSPFKADEKTPWELLGEQLTDLEEAIRATSYGAFDVNALTSELKPPEKPTERVPQDETPPEARELMNLFKDLSNLATDDPAPIRQRWLRGISFLDSAATHISRVKGELASRPEGLEGPGNAFISLAPQHTTIERGWSLFWKPGLADVNWSDFRQKLRSLDTVVCSLELHQSMYQPIWWPSRMRRVSIKNARPTAATITADASVDDEDTDAEAASEPDTEKREHTPVTPPSEPAPTKIFELDVQYSGFTQAWKDIAKGDYLIHVGERNTKTVFEVSECLDHTVRCRQVKTSARDEKQPEWEPGNAEEGYAIKAFDPIDYMAGMYAIYMFHALFYRSNSQGVTDYGNRVAAHSIDFPVGANIALPSEYMSKGRFEFWKQDRKPFDEVAVHSCVLCVWLMLGGYRSTDTDTECWTLITREIQAWMTNVLAHLGVDSPRIRALRYPSNSEIDPSILDLVNPEVEWGSFNAEDWYREVNSFLAARG